MVDLLKRHQVTLHVASLQQVIDFNEDSAAVAAFRMTARLAAEAESSILDHMAQGKH